MLEVVRDTRLRISEMSTPISADINIKRRRLFETLTFQARRITANAVIVFTLKNHTAPLHSEYPAIACVVYNDWRYLLQRYELEKKMPKKFPFNFSENSMNDKKTPRRMVCKWNNMYSVFKMKSLLFLKNVLIFASEIE